MPSPKAMTARIKFSERNLALNDLLETQQKNVFALKKQFNEITFSIQREEQKQRNFQHILNQMSDKEQFRTLNDQKNSVLCEKTSVLVERDQVPLLNHDLECLDHLSKTQKQDIVHIKKRHEVLKRWDNDIQSRISSTQREVDKLREALVMGNNAPAPPRAEDGLFDNPVVKNELSLYLEKVQVGKIIEEEEKVIHKNRLDEENQIRIEIETEKTNFEKEYAQSEGRLEQLSQRLEGLSNDLAAVMKKVRVSEKDKIISKISENYVSKDVMNDFSRRFQLEAEESKQKNKSSPINQMILLQKTEENLELLKLFEALN